MAREEMWRDIPGYNGDYLVSNFGRVKSFKRGAKLIKVCNHPKGYSFVTLWKDGNQMGWLVHRLVGVCF